MGWREWMRRQWAQRAGGWFGPYGSGDKALLALLTDGHPTAAGVSVNEYTALNLSAVWAAVTVISGDIASLPLVLYKRLPAGGKERDVDHPLYELLHDAPNPEQTAFVFRETLQQHVLLWGNGYAEIQRTAEGRPVALWLLTPDRVQPFRDPGSRAIRYRVTLDDGRQVVLESDDVLHVPGLGFDGIQGYSVVQRARESLGLGLAQERFASSFFGNGAWPGLVAQHPGKLSPEAHNRLKTSLNDALQGPSRAHRLILTEEGVKVDKVGIPPNDAQFLESRQFSVLEIARWFNLPPHKLRDLSRATYSNIEHQGIDYVIDLRRWLVPIEQEIRRKLIRPLERKRQFVEHLVEGLLRGDTTARFAAYAVGRQWGWFCVDDIREKENMNPLPNGAGQVYLMPGNMVPADRADDVIDAQVRPTPAPTPAPAMGPESDGADGGGRMRRFAALVAEELRPQLAQLVTARDVEAVAAEVVGQALKAVPPPPRLPDFAEAEARLGAQIADVVEGTVAAIDARLKAVPPPPVPDLAGAEARLVAQIAEAAEGTAAAIEARLEAATAAQHTREEARLEAAAAAQQARVEWVATLIPTLHELIEGALRREMRFEADRARKAAQTPDKLRAWLEPFYATREDTVLPLILPALRLHFTLLGRADDAEAEARLLLRRAVTTSREALTGLLDEEPAETLEAAVRVLVGRWETERPAALAEALMREAVGHGAAGAGI